MSSPRAQHSAAAMAAQASPPIIAHDHPPKQILSVDDLLDHTWHYECVVSASYSAVLHLSADPMASNPSLTSPSPSPSPAVLPTSFPQRPSTEYVSLASFINLNSNPSSNGRNSTALGLFRHSKPTTTVLSKCRGKERLRLTRGDPSRISFYAGWLTVD